MSKLYSNLSCLLVHRSQHSSLLAPCIASCGQEDCHAWIHLKPILTTAGLDFGRSVYAIEPLSVVNQAQVWKTIIPTPFKLYLIL